jgi:hypothetical protein
VKSAAAICGTSPPEDDACDDVESDELLHAAKTSENAANAPIANDGFRTDLIEIPPLAVPIDPKPISGFALTRLERPRRAPPVLEIRTAPPAGMPPEPSLWGGRYQ